MLRRRVAALASGRTPLVLVGGFVLALAVRLTLRDRAPLLATLYYATPPIVLACVAVTIAILFRLRRAPRAALAWSVVAIAFAGWHGFGHWRSPRPTSVHADLRVVLWNACWLAAGLDDVAEELKALAPDVVVLTEGGNGTGAEVARWRQHFPAHSVAVARKGFVVLARGRTHVVREERLSGDRGRAAVFDLSVSGTPLRLVAVDLDSNPLLGRGPAIGALVDLVRDAPGDAPLLVLGDFNLTDDSALFDRLTVPLGLRDAFAVAGQGYACTWPEPAPVLVIDHVFCGPRVTPVRCLVAPTDSSDHRPVVVDLALGVIR